MHEHSEKIQPKKLIVTIILAILLFVFAYIYRTDKAPDPEKKIQESVSEINKLNSSDLKP